MHLRPMTTADAAFAAALTTQTLEAAAWSEADYLCLLQPGGPAAGYGFIAEQSEADATPQPVGFLVARIVADEAEILNVVVGPAARRKGVGTALIRDALRLAASRGVYRVFLEVRASNQAARQLYSNSGFGEIGRRAGYYHSPLEDAIVLQRDLPSD